MDSVPCRYNGVVSTDTTITTNVNMYEGSDKIKLTDISIADKDGLEVTPTCSGKGTKDGKVEVVLPVGTVLSKDRYNIKIELQSTDSKNTTQTKQLNLTINVVKAGQDGTPGKDSYTADLDNEMDSIALTSDGKAYNITDSIKTNIWVSKGNTKVALKRITVGTIQLQSGVSNDVGNNFNCTYKNNNSVYELTFIPKNTSTTINTKNSFPISLQYNDENGNELTSNLNFTINGIKAAKDGQDGQDGESPILYRLVPSVKQVVIDKDGKYSVDEITCNITKTVNGTTVNTTESGITINCYKDGATTATILTPGTGKIKTNSFSHELKLELVMGGQVHDVETISLVSDGLTAKPNLLRNTNFDVVDSKKGLLYYNYTNGVNIIQEGFNGYNVASKSLAGRSLEQMITLEPGKSYALSGYAKNNHVEGELYNTQCSGWLIQKAPTSTEDKDYIHKEELDFGLYEDGKKRNGVFYTFWGGSPVVTDSIGKRGTPNLIFGPTPEWEFKTITFKYKGTIKKDVMITTLYQWSQHDTNTGAGTTQSSSYIAAFKLEEGEVATPYIKHMDDYKSPLKSTVFKRSNGNPETPSGGDYNNPIPEGWSDGIPSTGTGAIWSSTNTFYATGVSTGWSTPQIMADSAEFDVCYSYSSTKPSAPTSHGTQNGSIRIIKNGGLL